MANQNQLRYVSPGIGLTHFVLSGKAHTEKRPFVSKKHEVIEDVYQNANMEEALKERFFEVSFTSAVSRKEK